MQGKVFRRSAARAVAKAAPAARSTSAPARAARGGASSIPLSIVVLAAGQGRRMRSALPKVLQPLAGQPLLAHVLDVAAALAPRAIRVVYGHGGERVREHFATATPADPSAQGPAKPSLGWTRQDEQLGTGHALQQAMPQVPDDHQVLVLYGDVPLLRAETLRALLERAPPGGCALLSAILEDPSGYGRVLRDRRGRVRRIVEDGDARGAERAVREVNTGVLVAPARLLKQWLAALKPHNAQGEFYLTDVVAAAVAEKRAVETLPAADPAETLGVNDKRQLARAEAEYRRRRADELMAQGVTLVDPARVDLRGAIEVDCDVLLDVNVVLIGPVRLGAGVTIGPNCVIRNASIGAGTVMFPNCVVQDAEIGGSCQIGPFTRLRPGARIEAGVHLGNFVEVKNSRIGPRSKINHLSYVGDTTVGQAVNIGAGTITCNYDGAAKWPTHIGDGAFIGSGTMLVAPVSIGEQAMIGAGSTITADAPAGKLTLARSRQLTIENWQRRRGKPDKG